MRFLPSLIVFKKLLKSDRLKSVNVYARVQHSIPAAKERPEVHIRLPMDVTVDHIRPLRVLPAKERIMT